MSCVVGCKIHSCFCISFGASLVVTLNGADIIRSQDSWESKVIAPIVPNSRCQLRSLFWLCESAVVFLCNFYISSSLFHASQTRFSSFVVLLQRSVSDGATSLVLRGLKILLFNCHSNTAEDERTYAMFEYMPETGVTNNGWPNQLCSQHPPSWPGVATWFGKYLVLC